MKNQLEMIDMRIQMTDSSTPFIPLYCSIVII